MSEVHSQLRLANSRRSQDDSQRAGKEPAAEQLIEPVDSRLQSGYGPLRFGDVCGG